MLKMAERAQGGWRKIRRFTTTIYGDPGGLKKKAGRGV